MIIKSDTAYQRAIADAERRSTEAFGRGQQRSAEQYAQLAERLRDEYAQWQQHNALPTN